MALPLTGGSLMLGAGMMSSCSNGDNTFPDFDYQTVYFANQYADRTVELGEDEFVDLTTDNQHIVNINATWGGGYDNRKDVIIKCELDKSLVNNLYFKNTVNPVQVMPDNYYTIQSDMNISIPSGKIMGGLKVQLTDAFFNDPNSVNLCYVIPVRMTQVVGADSILSGKAAVDNPILTDDSHWSTQPKNFVLYAVKFVNPWHGQYLRRGVDNATIDGKTSTIVRHQQYVENDEVVDVTTTGFKKNVLPVTVKDKDGNNVTVNLTLNFADDNSFTITCADADATASGSGKFVSKGEQKSLGGKDRDALYLDYKMECASKGLSFATKDTLVLRTRNVYGGSTFGVERH
ncbi:MAG: DUF1735 domain-containing protein [Bacteroidaceae bacterium]|nr:DUF1735 domain-containing protein [Bacteroidaceae bacterium]